MAEKLSELERWLQHMQSEGDRESSGRFTVDAGSRLERYQTLLALNPSLPWLHLTQWAHSQQAAQIELRVLRDAVEWVATGVRSDGQWRGRVSQLEGEDALMLLLHAWKPESLQFRWSGFKTGWEWSWPDNAPAHPPRAFVPDSLSVRIQVTLSPTQRRDLVAEFIARTHFACVPIRIDGRPHPSRLDLTSTQARSFGVAADLVKDPEAECFAVGPPAMHQARIAQVNGTLVDSPAWNETTAFPTACYHLHHPELSTQTGEKSSEHIDLGKTSLLGSGAFLGPSRSWSSLEFFGIPLRSQSLRPMRARSLYLLSANPDRGAVQVVPIRGGVSLNPISLPGYRAGSTTISLYPTRLQTDLSGLKLVEDEACRRRCL